PRRVLRDLRRAAAGHHHAPARRHPEKTGRLTARVLGPGVRQPRRIRATPLASNSTLMSRMNVGWDRPVWMRPPARRATSATRKASATASSVVDRAKLDPLALRVLSEEP